MTLTVSCCYFTYLFRHCSGKQLCGLPNYFSSVTNRESPMTTTVLTKIQSECSFLYASPSKSMFLNLICQIDNILESLILLSL